MNPSPKNPEPSGSKLTQQEQENLTAYLDHELNDAETEQITAALSRRPEVRKEADSLRKTWELLDYLPRPQAPQSFTEQTLTRLNSTKGILLQQGMKWRRYAIAGWAACILIAAAFGFWLTNSAFREPEIVEVPSPVTDVLPIMESQPVESAPATASRPFKKDRADIRLLPRNQREISQQRNERLTRDIWKVLTELRKKMTDEEKDRLLELSRKGGLPYLAKVIELAQQYKIPLVDTQEGTAPVKPNKKGMGKNLE